jgi:glycine cleavage system regulatory protein
LIGGLVMAHSDDDGLVLPPRLAPSSGIQVVAQRTSDAGDGEGSSEVSIELVGQDRPGIVHEITEVLARHGVNVKELETTVRSASMSGESLFLAHASVLVPADADMEKLRDELEALANELMVDISLSGGD